MAGLAEKVISHISAPVGRPRINDEATPARFPAGTLDRVDALLAPKEKRSDFIREAVEAEIAKRLTSSSPTSK